MNDELDNTSWDQYRRLIVSELERLNQGIAELNRKMDNLKTDDLTKMKLDIRTLQMRLGFLGIVAGSVGAGALELVKMAFTK